MVSFSAVRRSLTTDMSGKVMKGELLVWSRCWCTFGLKAWWCASVYYLRGFSRSGYPSWIIRFLGHEGTIWDLFFRQLPTIMQNHKARTKSSLNMFLFELLATLKHGNNYSLACGMLSKMRPKLKIPAEQLWSLFVQYNQLAVLTYTKTFGCTWCAKWMIWMHYRKKAKCLAYTYSYNQDKIGIVLLLIFNTAYFCRFRFRRQKVEKYELYTLRNTS